MLENMISIAKFKLNCKNGDQGCQVEMKSDDLTEHEFECQFRLVPCPNASCQEMVNFSLLDAHYLENADNLIHRMDIEEGGDVINLGSCDVYQDGDTDWGSLFCVQSGFRFCRTFVKRHDLWYTWVSIEAGLKQATRFKFSIKVEKRNTMESASIAGIVSPIDWTVEEVLRSGSYLTLTLATVNKLKEESQDGDDGWELHIACSVALI